MIELETNLLADNQVHHSERALEARIVHSRPDRGRKACRSGANRLLAEYTLRILNSRDLRPKFRRLNGLLDTACHWRE